MVNKRVQYEPKDFMGDENAKSNQRIKPPAGVDPKDLPEEEIKKFEETAKK